MRCSPDGQRPSAPLSPRTRVIVLIIVIVAVATMVVLGYQATIALGVVAAMGVLAEEICRRLAGPQT